jgi:GWxTD domain-containing protein
MKFLNLCCVLILLLSQNAYCQTEMSQSRLVLIPDFYYDIINNASDKPGQSHIDIYVEISYDELQFLKVDSGFKAQCELSATIFDKDKDQIDGKTWQEELFVKEYEQTNSRELICFTKNQFNLDINDYQVVMQLMDQETKKIAKRSIPLKIRDFSTAKLILSDITFADSLLINDNKIERIRPRPAEHIKAEGTELFCCFDIYSQDKEDDKFKITYKIINNKNKVVLKQEYVSQRKDIKTLESIRLEKANLSHGHYQLIVEVEQGKQKETISKVFNLYWLGIPGTISDLSEAIEQLKYIAKPKEMKTLKKASDEERLDRFREFWKGRDPSPGTAKNELMEEYYRRVKYCDENFSSFRQGWKTDMGMIYIIFGPPNDIERHPFDQDSKPYEVWTYYELNRQFVFLDETGFGDYRLLNPFWRDSRIGDGIYY